MANTNSPRTNTHQSFILPPTGSHIEAEGRVMPRYYNCYPIKVQNFAQDPSYHVVPRERCTRYPITFALDDEIKGVYDNFGTGIFVVRENSLYRFNGGSSTPILVTTIDQPVLYSSSDLYRVDNVIYIGILVSCVSNNYLYLIDPLGTLVHTTSLPVSLYGRLNSLTFLDGFFFACSTTSQRIYNSTLGAPQTWDYANDFIDAEIFGDSLVALAKHHNHIVAFGDNSTEFFYNAAKELGSPLQRQASYSVKIGMWNHSAQGNMDPLMLHDDVYFLGGTFNNLTGLYKISRFNIEKVSDTLITNRIQGSPQGFVDLLPIYLKGELCLLISIVSGIPLVYIPSLGVYVEFQFPFTPAHSVVVNSPGSSLRGTFFSERQGVNPFWVHAPRLPGSSEESFTAMYTTEYMDLNNNDRKHWKYVDVLGTFNDNQIGLAYRSDNYAFDNTYNVSLPYVNALTYREVNPIRFRNLGRSQRRSYTVFISGTSDFIFKGLNIAYNQGTS